MGPYRQALASITFLSLDTYLLSGRHRTISDGRRAREGRSCPIEVEQVQRWLPEARIVKAFNFVGSAHMVNPSFPGGPPDMFICGNDAAAKQTVTGICEAFGWPVIDIGGIEGARLLEPLAMLWVLYGIRSGSWNHTFKLLRK